MKTEKKITVGTEGTLEVIRKITCPFCNLSEIADEIGQFENFEFEGFADKYETLQIWKCASCGGRFFTDLDKI